MSFVYIHRSWIRDFYAVGKRGFATFERLIDWICHSKMREGEREWEIRENDGKLVLAWVSDPAAAVSQLHLKGESAEKFLGGNRTRGESQTAVAGPIKRPSDRRFWKKIDNIGGSRPRGDERTADAPYRRRIEQREKGPRCAPYCFRNDRRHVIIALRYLTREAVFRWI